MAAGMTASSSRTVPALHLAHLERRARAALQHAVQFTEDVRHRGLPPVDALEVRDVDVRRIDAAEPASQPVVHLVVDHRQERRRGDDEVDGRLGEFRRVVGRLRQQPRPLRRLRQVARVGVGQILQERTRLLQHDRAQVAPRRHLPARLVDLPLVRDRGRLVRRERVDRQEAGRMAGQAVHGHHADPAVDAVEGAVAFTFEQVVPERRDRVERRGMVEHLQVVRRPHRPIEIDRLQAPTHVVDGRRAQPRLEQHGAERVDVAGERAPGPPAPPRGASCRGRRTGRRRRRRAR